MTEVAPSLSIGQVAERTGLSVHALRFYEREGIFADPVRRGAGGRRVYSEDDVEWLSICTRFRASVDRGDVDGGLVADGELSYRVATARWRLS